MTTQPVHNKTSPKDFFLHLLAMVSLYGSAISLCVVLFQLVNIGIPDPLDQAGGYYYAGDMARRLLRNGLSFLIVLFPVYGATMWHLNKSYLADESKRNLRVRKWLTYFTLFVAALIIIFTVVTLLNHLLNGELTLRFGLKVLSVVFVAGSIFGYYFWDLKKYKTE